MCKCMRRQIIADSARVWRDTRRVRPNTKPGFGVMYEDGDAAVRETQLPRTSLVSRVELFGQELFYQSSDVVLHLRM